jgi:hypothetical protein
VDKKIINENALNLLESLCVIIKQNPVIYNSNQTWNAIEDFFAIHVMSYIVYVVKIAANILINMKKISGIA